MKKADGNSPSDSQDFKIKEARSPFPKDECLPLAAAALFLSIASYGLQRDYSVNHKLGSKSYQMLIH